MTTDKDREEAKAYLEKLFSGKTGTGSWHGIKDKWSESELIEMQAERDSRIRAESADQARKEAAERVVAFIRTLNSESMDLWSEYEDNGLRTAILGDSVVKENLITDHIPDTGKKLAIAVKALEEIKKIGKAGPAFETHFSKLQYIGAVTNDALKEIQG